MPFVASNGFDWLTVIILAVNLVILAYNIYHWKGFSKMERNWAGLQAGCALFLLILCMVGV